MNNSIVVTNMGHYGFNAILLEAMEQYKVQTNSHQCATYRYIYNEFINNVC
jgi:hypothetical protein